MKPGAHSTPHWPSTHTATPPAAEGQALPQLPQFSTSPATSLQLVPHGTKGAWHANEHSESTQTGLPFGGALQVVPQERQLLSSSFSTTHAPAHTVSPSRQTTGSPEVPPIELP